MPRYEPIEIGVPLECGRSDLEWLGAMVQDDAVQQELSDSNSHTSQQSFTK